MLLRSVSHRLTTKLQSPSVSVYDTQSTKARFPPYLQSPVYLEVLCVGRRRGHPSTDVGQGLLSHTGGGHLERVLTLPRERERGGGYTRNTCYWSGREADRQTDTDTQTQTHRQTDILCVRQFLQHPSCVPLKGSLPCKERGYNTGPVIILPRERKKYTELNIQMVIILDRYIDRWTGL